MQTPQQEGRLELWVGPECTINRVGDRWQDQSRSTGFAHRADDVERLASLGATRVRVPVLWERAARLPGALDLGWGDQLLRRMAALGLEPIVGLLHHGSGPRHTSLVDPHFPTLFADYARQVAERFPHVRDWTPINEPLTTARFSCLYGLWYPHAADDASFVRALLNQVHATVRAMRAIRAVNPAARLVQTDDLGFTRSTPALADQAAFDNERRWLAFDLLCGRVDERHPLWAWLCASGAQEEELERLRQAPCAPDIIGINAYVTSERFLDERLELHPPHLHGGNGRQVYADVETVRAHGALIDGFGPRLRETHARYGLPVAITEVHMGCTREEQLRWLHQAWHAALAARRDGVDVRGVTAWAAFGTVDWSSLLTREANHYEPGLWDIRSEPPRLTALGRLAAALGRGETSHDPAFPLAQGTGWWQRDLRLNVAPHGTTTALAARGPTLLIVGRGPLARAFARLSHMRGLPYAWRESAADLGPEALLDLLHSQDVWAIVETVEDARAMVVRAPAQVRRLAVHVDWSAQASIPAAPGSSSLHVHTGRLFGPWSGTDDELATGLALLDQGEPWHADADEVVWPTYIPDLVQASLDLLIDGETGDWLLTQGESMSWWDFARRAATHAGRDAALVRQRRDGRRLRHHEVPAVRTARLLPALDDALSRFRNDYEPDPVDPPPLPAQDERCRSVPKSAAHLTV